VDNHIELVKKWLLDNDSVSQAELKVNSDAADAAANAVWNTAADAAYAPWNTAAKAATAAAADAAKAATDAAYWVKIYEELTYE
jgi:hypothetical protein